MALPRFRRSTVNLCAGIKNGTVWLRKKIFPPPARRRTRAIGGACCVRCSGGCFWHWCCSASIHQRTSLAMERTPGCIVPSRCTKTNVLYDAVGTLDGKQISSGDNISLGSHQFTITEPKAESFTTNFFAWYGRHDFGKINLKRAMGTLNVTAEPGAQVIAITGPEFSLTLYDSTGTNLVVPTDGYQISAQYARWSDARNYQVTAGNSTLCSFAPQLGAVSVTCNETPAAFELQDANGNVVERGGVPAIDNRNCQPDGISSSWRITITRSNKELPCLPKKPMKCRSILLSVRHSLNPCRRARRSIRQMAFTWAPRPLW